MEKQQPALADATSGKSIAPPSTDSLTPADKAKAKLVLYGGLVLAVIGAVVGGFHGHSIPREARKIAATWARTEATVMEIDKRGTLKKPKTYVSLFYLVNGRPGGTVWEMGRSTDYKQGDKVAVFVSPSDGSKAKSVTSVEADAHKNPSAMMWRGIAFGFFGAPFMALLAFLVLAASWVRMKKLFGQG